MDHYGIGVLIRKIIVSLRSDVPAEIFPRNHLKDTLQLGVYFSSRNGAGLTLLASNKRLAASRSWPARCEMAWVSWVSSLSVHMRFQARWSKRRPIKMRRNSVLASVFRDNEQDGAYSEVMGNKMLLDQLRAQKGAIAALSNQYGARRIRVFGSVARGEEQADSDVDFLVDFPRGYDLFAQRLALTERLADLLDRRVELVPEHELNRHIRDRVLSEAVEL